MTGFHTQGPDIGTALQNAIDNHQGEYVVVEAMRGVHHSVTVDRDSPTLFKYRVPVYTNEVAAHRAAEERNENPWDHYGPMRISRDLRLRIELVKGVAENRKDFLTSPLQALYDNKHEPTVPRKSRYD